MEYYRLCYIDKNKAWFTNNFEKQWGDDWDDTPYECNAGEPYEYWSELIQDNEDLWKRKWEKHLIKHKVLYFETDDWSEQQPCDMGEFSIEQVNKQAVAWLCTDKFTILAGTTYENFIDIIEKKWWQNIFAKRGERMKRKIIEIYAEENGNELAFTIDKIEKSKVANDMIGALAIFFSRLRNIKEDFQIEYEDDEEDNLDE